MAKKAKMRVRVYPIGELPYTTEIYNDLKSMQELVGGYIERTPLNAYHGPPANGLMAIVDEEGCLKGKPRNRIFVGQFFVCSSRGDMSSLKDVDIEKLEQLEVAGAL